MRRVTLGVATVAVLALAAVLVAQAAENGRLKLGATGVVITLKSGDSTVTVGAGESDVAVAPGTYTPTDITLTRKQITGTNGTKVETQWTLQSKGPFGQLAQVTVEPGKTTELKAGQPLTLTARPQPGAGSVAFAYAVVGASGEAYSAVAMKDGKPAASPPKITILDEAGKVLESGSFQFG